MGLLAICLLAFRHAAHNSIQVHGGITNTHQLLRHTKMTGTNYSALLPTAFGCNLICIPT